VVDAGALDLGAIPRGRRIIQAEQQARRAARQEGHGDPHQEKASDPLGAPAEAGEQIVAGAEVGSEAGRAEPAGDRASAPREQQAGEQQGEALLLPDVEGAGQKDRPSGQLGRQAA
jgi:hypothetical protein